MIETALMVEALLINTNSGGDIIEKKFNTGGEVISFTVITRTDGKSVSKVIRPDGQGGIFKTASANISQGSMQRVAMPFVKFGQFIRSLSNNQAIAHGVPINHGGDDYQKFSFGVMGQEDPPKKLSRSKKFLGYPTDTHCLCMFDHDPKPGQQYLAPEELIKIICGIVPDFDNCPTWSTPSTSAYIYDLEGNALSGEGAGFHLYFPFNNPALLPTFVDTLFKRLWLAGHGYVFVSKGGALLERTNFDTAVFSPERLDFVSGAICENCKQRLPEPVFRIGKKEFLYENK